ncbi:hypothetical protein HMPREF9695_01277 [Afipia broomeae ATCC 49717]|uniref:Uncharacterized protein n=1 Tax=Afipia broomeae ATCC 49717 TaxID=883078 RepID=K8PRN5_9BRAD|nr:hypothetical protein HMPREF9695_01277 [Afipia broomeae ATCC 49717]
MFLNNGPAWPGATCTIVVVGASVTKSGTEDTRVIYPNSKRYAGRNENSPGNPKQSRWIADRIDGI